MVGALRGRRACCSPSSRVVERRAREPILPFEILRNPIVAGSVACMALVGMAMFGTISYVPLFVQGVIGTSATSSGVVLTPLMLGAVTTSLLTGQLVSRTGRYRWNAILGPVVLTAGMVLLWRMDVDDDERRGRAQHGHRRHRDRLDDAGLRARRFRTRCRARGSARRRR